MVKTAEGQPFEVLLSPGKYHESDPFKLMNLGLPLGSSLYGDSAYTDITAFLPRKIHAITAAGFELKVMGFIMPFQLILL